MIYGPKVNLIPQGPRILSLQIDVRPMEGPIIYERVFFFLLLLLLFLFGT
jgi:hypothetical protein